MKNLLEKLLDLVLGTREVNCRECGKLCHRHAPGCTVPPGEIGEVRA